MASEELTPIQEGGLLGSESTSKNGIRISIATKLVLSFLLIIILTSAIFTTVGIVIISDHIKSDAQEQLKEDIESAREIYLSRLNHVNSVVRSTAESPRIREAVLSGNAQQAAYELVGTRMQEALDILTITDESGNVLLQTSNLDYFNDDKSRDELVTDVMRDEMPVAATEVIAAEELDRDPSQLADEASAGFAGGRETMTREEIKDTDIMMLGAAAPILDSQKALIGVVHGGFLLNRNLEFICEIKQEVFPDAKYNGKEVGFVTIYQEDVGILSCPRNVAGSGAIGYQITEEIYDQVINEGKPWVGRDLVMDEWYITVYEPIKNSEYETVGILQVGVLEQKYIDIRNQLLIAFIAITLLGALVAIFFSYFISKRISVPLNKLVSASRDVAHGNLDARVDIKSMSNDELGELANAFNTMASALEERDKKLMELTSSRIRRSERLALIGRLSAGVAHELNNPLQGIVTYSHLLLERMPADNPNKDSVQVIVTQADRCRDIIRGLLDFSRQREPVKTLSNINLVLFECISLLENQVLFQNIEITKDFDAELPFAVIDPSQMERVFMNMIINAAEAMDGRGCLTLVTGSDPLEQNIEIKFIDSGVGIAEEDLRRIFDPFFTTKEVGHGTGLGLAISYGIVKEHGGTISVKSRVGKGTTFTVKLPLTVVESA